VKRPREEEQGSVLPPGFFDAGAGAEARPPAEPVVASQPAGAAAGGTVPTEQAAGAVLKQAASAGGGGGAAIGLELAYGSSDEDEDLEEEVAVPAQQQPAEPSAPAAPAALPEGFFDDRTKDAIAHNKPAPKKLDIDEVSLMCMRVVVSVHMYVHEWMCASSLYTCIHVHVYI